MQQDPLESLVKLASRSSGPEPVTWVPIDEDGNDAGAPEVDFPPPDTPQAQLERPVAIVRLNQVGR